MFENSKRHGTVYLAAILASFAERPLGGRIRSNQSITFHTHVFAVLSKFHMDVSESDIVEYNCFNFDLKSEQIEIINNVMHGKDQLVR